MWDALECAIFWIRWIIRLIGCAAVEGKVRVFNDKLKINLFIRS